MLYEDEAYRCENPLCHEALKVDHVTVITTAHVRRFCDLECVVCSVVEINRRILSETDPSSGRRTPDDGSRGRKGAGGRCPVRGQRPGVLNGRGDG